GNPVTDPEFERRIAEHGGSSGLRDEARPAPALARPQHLFAYIVDLAATLVCGLTRNHPFVDGNKRTAFVACRTFPELNEVALTVPREEKYLIVLALLIRRENSSNSWKRARESSTRATAKIASKLACMLFLTGL